VQASRPEDFITILPAIRWAFSALTKTSVRRLVLEHDSGVQNLDFVATESGISSAKFDFAGGDSRLQQRRNLRFRDQIKI
jgi:hypothetical protein